MRTWRLFLALAVGPAAAGLLTGCLASIGVALVAAGVSGTLIGIGIVLAIELGGID